MMNTSVEEAPYAEWSAALAGIRARAGRLVAPLSPAERQRTPRAEAWSVDQILEHLVISNNGYAESMARAIDAAATRGGSAKAWKPTFVGRILRQSVDPSSTRRLRSPKKSRPWPAIAPGVLDRFIGSVDALEQLLHRSREAGAASQRFSSPLAPIIRLNVGDGFAVCVAHARRHLLQIERTITDVQRLG
ncbi:MAG: DinB family protein [Gemmatimonadota bacterium]